MESDELIRRIYRDVSRTFTPPPDLTISEWADRYLYLSPEDSAEPGKFSTARAPYQRGMVDAVCDPGVREVVFCTSSQIGKTIMLRSIIGYHIHQDPGPLLLLMPTVEMAESFSKVRLAPMLRDTPVLRDRIVDPKSRSSGNTIRAKIFPGGTINMVGANAPSELSSRPCRIVMADEVSRYPASAGTEGDPIFLARQRSVNFWNRKLILASTPEVEGTCRITRAFLSSDQRHYHLPCPHCGEMQVLRWINVHWDGDDASSARMVCTHCGGIFDDADKVRMLPHGQWVADKPFNGVAGFHINALYSPWQRFSDVVQEFLDKKDSPLTMQTFVNLQLGEAWQDRSGESVQSDVLMKRRETWDAVPEDVVLLTAGVDCQDDRLEITLVGWTGDDRARVLGHYVLGGSPGEPAVWAKLGDFLDQRWDTCDRRLLRVKAACVDSGGHHTQAVYDFCSSRIGRKIIPIRGRAGPYPIWPPKGQKTKLSTGSGVRVYLVGVDTAKDTLRAMLAVSNPQAPKYVSFASELADEYFRQLTAERRKTHTNRSGRVIRTWVKAAGIRNEALDCMVYAIAALNAIKADGVKLRMVERNTRAAQYADKLIEDKPLDRTAIAPAPAPPPAMAKAPPRRRTSSAVL